jgi:hypothetical protein
VTAKYRHQSSDIAKNTIAPSGKSQIPMAPSDKRKSQNSDGKKSDGGERIKVNFKKRKWRNENRKFTIATSQNLQFPMAPSGKAQIPMAPSDKQISQIQMATSDKNPMAEKELK